ncbi:MAG: sulfite exporter TauE/SafE family protein [Defluviitaleaceae bacterium]|nr:sulfite exporter TauE/SafE family protein [Defluviitaleaceae bacterium]
MNKTILSALVGIVTGFANGLFGSGGGTLLVPALQRFFDIETHKSHATALSVILPLSVLSAWIYVRGDTVNWQAVFWITVGGVPGGFTGALLLNKVSSKWLHRIFGAFMITAALRLIFS